MKNKYFVILIAPVCALILICLCCCHKTKDSTSSSPTAILGLHMHTAIDTTQVSPDSLNVFLTDSQGRYTKLQYAQLYVSNISLHSTSGKWVTISDSIMLKREESEEYPIGNVPADTYDDLKFTVGLNSTINTAPQPSVTSGVDTVISATTESFMYFGAGQGYKFLTLAGWVDTTAAHSGTHLIAFNYAIGGTGNSVDVTLPVSVFTLAPNVPVVQYVHINADYGKILQGLSLSELTTPVSSSAATPPTGIAAKIWNRIASMFRYECTTPNGNC